MKTLIKMTKKNSNFRISNKIQTVYKYKMNMMIKINKIKTTLMIQKKKEIQMTVLSLIMNKISINKNKKIIDKIHKVCRNSNLNNKMQKKLMMNRVFKQRKNNKKKNFKSKFQTQTC